MYKWPDVKIDYDVIIIGGGQSALACGYFLRRTGLHFVLLDDQERSGGVWLHAWDSLTLFSPAEYSSLPGWLMPASQREISFKGVAGRLRQLDRICISNPDRCWTFGKANCE